MKKVLETIAKNIVDNPKEVRVKAKEDGQAVILELSVADEDMGKVIGKRGRVAKAIRTIITASAIKANKKVTVEIVD
ncbi:KH domain-containing protein [Orenia marismortui]|uniref:RNA-binding protein KhpA n=1 Tax=Orenia marismortui TaxID=46469 RepID=A0A4R8H4V1_9FIRM|nr:KH domain-containing protein [Orenia marismortui]TDX51965.1 RNA-binding protein with KH domain [Orenia marismortui]